MVSRGLALKLRPGAYDEYKRRHDELWPEIVAMMSELEISSVIFRHGDALFVHETAPSREHLVRADQAAITPKWDEHMKEVLETDSAGVVISVELPLTFSFGDFVAGSNDPTASGPVEAG